MITKASILACTHYGVQIYAHILRQFYPNETVIKVADKQIKSFCAKEILVNVQHGRYEKIGHCSYGEGNSFISVNRVERKFI